MSRIESRNTGRQKGSAFLKFYLAYLVLIVVLLAALFIYVRGIMVKYENSNADQYILSMLEDGKGSDLSKFLEKNCFSDERGSASDRSKDYYDKAANAELTLKTAQSYKEGVKVYNVFADGKPFVTVGLSEAKTETKLGIITITEWTVDTAVLRNENSASGNIKLTSEGDLVLEVSLPEGFTLMLDGKSCVLPEGEISDIKDFQYVSAYTSVPKMNTSSLADLYFEPELSALNNGGETVSPTLSSGVYTFAADYASTAEAEALVASSVDPIAIAELWSKFMTDDVGGTKHGLETVVSDCRLIKDSNLYERAVSWSSLTDINFVSVHTLKGFSNERISNCVKYSDTLLSCDVYAEKNMRLKTGSDRTDIFDNRMYFVYLEKGVVEEAGWYLADMVSL